MDAFHLWLESVDLIDYETDLVKSGIDSKSKFGNFDSKQSFETFVTTTIGLTASEDIDKFYSAYNSLITPKSGISFVFLFFLWF